MTLKDAVQTAIVFACGLALVVVSWFLLLVAVDQFVWHVPAWFFSVSGAVVGLIYHRIIGSVLFDK